jgi:hypothetical protein
MRCTQINRVGEQCRGQAVAGSELCAFHAGILEGRTSSALDDDDVHQPRRQSRFPLIYRVAAGLLLLIFALEIARTVRGWFHL